MSETTSILPIRQGDEDDDPLTALAREGARRALPETLAVEADAFVACLAEARFEDGRQRVVRHGSGPDRVDRDWHWPRTVAPAQEPAPDSIRGPRPGSRRYHRGGRPERIRAHRFHLGDPALVGAVHQEPRWAAAGSQASAWGRARLG